MTRREGPEELKREPENRRMLCVELLHRAGIYNMFIIFIEKKKKRDFTITLRPANSGLAKIRLHKGYAVKGQG